MTTSNHLTHSFHEAIEADASPAAQAPLPADRGATVRTSHGLACPNCGDDTCLFVTGFIQVEIAPRRYRAFGAPSIRESNDIQCVKCGNFGTVAAWRVAPCEDTDLFCVG